MEPSSEEGAGLKYNGWVAKGNGDAARKEEKNGRVRAQEVELQFMYRALRFASLALLAR